MIEPAASFTYSFIMDKWKMYTELSAAGIAFAAAIIIGVLAGRWLDEQTGAGGVFTLMFIALGLAGAVLNLLRTLRKFGGEN